MGLRRWRFSLQHTVIGYLYTIYVFPETHSSAVVLTNAYSAGNCSDILAQMYVQVLFDIVPDIDFTQRAADRSTDNLKEFLAGTTT
jgi:hypothetical protein